MHYSNVRLYLVFILVVFIGCAPQQIDNNSEAARAGIEAANAQWMAAFDQGDGAGVAAKYTEDTQVMPPNSKIISGRSGAQAVFQSLIDAGFNVKLETVEVEGFGDTAYEIGTATITGQEGETIDVAKYMVIWKKLDSEWKLHRDIWNSNMPLPNTE